MLSPRLISRRIGHFRLPGVLYSVLHSPHDSCRVHEIVNQATIFVLTVHALRAILTGTGALQTRHCRKIVHYQRK